MTENQKAFNALLSEASGSFESNDRLVSFLYTLMRDSITPGEVAKILIEDRGATPPFQFTNGFLARYAEFVAKQIRNDSR